MPHSINNVFLQLSTLKESLTLRCLYGIQQLNAERKMNFRYILVPIFEPYLHFIDLLAPCTKFLTDVIFFVLGEEWLLLCDAEVII